jgi:hypothetical protein
MSLTKKVGHESDYLSTIVHSWSVYSFVTFWMCIYSLLILNNVGVLDSVICCFIK